MLGFASDLARAVLRWVTFRQSSVLRLLAASLQSGFAMIEGHSLGMLRRAEIATTPAQDSTAQGNPSKTKDQTLQYAAWGPSIGNVDPMAVE